MNYINAEMEIIAFENEDVIATSGTIEDFVKPEDNFNGGGIF
mgnify:CR=1 FL=1